MTEEALMDEINELREKLEQAESEFEGYKLQTKEMEEFLEAEAAKKENQIRKLKEQSILKEKNFKLLKVEVTQLLSETASLKGQLANGGNSESQQISEAMNKLQDENQDLRNSNSQLSKDLLKQKQVLWQMEKDKKELQQQWQIKFKKLTEQQNENAVYISRLESDKNSLVIQLAEAEAKKAVFNQVKTQSPFLERKNSKKQVVFNRQNFDRDKERYEEKIRKLEEQNNRNEKTIKEQKFKIQGLLQEKEQLKMNNRNNSRATLVPSPSVYKLSVAREESEWDSARMRYSCLLLTKYHYVSPFLEIHEGKNVIQIYKSTRTGCFQKSVGSTRHRFDQIGFEDEDVINPLVSRILESQSTNHHSIIIYGVKRSAKKYLMAKILVKLKQFLLHKLDYYGESEAVFLRRSADEQKNFTFKATDKETVMQLIDMVIALGHKKQKKIDKYRVFSPRKVVSKPKVRYFSIRLNDFNLQVGTSSYTNLVYRQKMSCSNMLNNIFYTKLPDILQSIISQKHMLLVINPIVDLYEDCKNTLSATLYKNVPVSKEDEQFKDWRGSPVREELNNATKKKVEILQRQNQQTSIKIKKLEEQIMYYRLRFDELECRLKNLLNTHSGQNSYLKKSPVTLSYQKLLKFVHSVQGRTSMNSSLSATNSGNLKMMAIEKGYDSSQEVL